MLGLGTMLHLEIQKGEETMKTSNFQRFLGGTTACMKRLSIVTKGCGQLKSNDTYFSDSWFGSIKNADEMAAAGVDYCGPEKTSHKVFFSHVRKFDERLAYRVISCFEEYSKISC